MAPGELSRVKPPIPYTVGTVLEAQVHHPSEPPDEMGRLSRELVDKTYHVSPLQLCLDNQPMTGSLDAGKLTFRITGTIVSEDLRRTQLANVEILKTREELTLHGHRLLAKFFDPLYADWEWLECDEFYAAESHYAREVQAYHHLKHLQGSIIPRFYGSYNVRVPVTDHPTFRAVRMILIESIPAKSLIEEDADSYTVAQRQEIMAAVIRSESAVRLTGLRHGDIHPRNFLLRWPEHSTPLKVLMIDFDRSTFWKRNVEMGTFGRDDPRRHNTAYMVKGCWADEFYSCIVQESFREWVEDWDFYTWLDHAFKE